MTTHDHALTPIDTAWLHMDDPTNLMMVTAIFEFDGPVDFERVKRTWGARLGAFDRFRQRVSESVIPLKAPHWEDDPNFDLDSHVHHISLPAPRSKKALLALIGDLASSPLDASKPLWQVHVIDNYRGGSVLVMRHHHCIADGTAMVGVLDRLMDKTADAPENLPDDERPREHDSLFDHWNHAAMNAISTTRKAAGTLARSASARQERAASRGRLIKLRRLMAVCQFPVSYPKYRKSRCRLVEDGPAFSVKVKEFIVFPACCS